MLEFRSPGLSSKNLTMDPPCLMIIYPVILIRKMWSNKKPFNYRSEQYLISIVTFLNNSIITLNLYLSTAFIMPRKNSFFEFKIYKYSISPAHLMFLSPSLLNKLNLMALFIQLFNMFAIPFKITINLL